MTRDELAPLNPVDIVLAIVEPAAAAAGLEVDHASFDAARAVLAAPTRAAGHEAASALSDEPNATQTGCSSPPRSTVARERSLSDVE